MNNLSAFLQPIQVCKNNKVQYMCPFETCMFCTTDETCFATHVQNDSHNQFSAMYYATCDESLGYVPSFLERTCIRVDKLYKVAVCHASQVMLTKDEIPAHCELCPYCEPVDSVEDVDDEMLNDLSSFESMFQVAGSLRVSGVTSEQLSTSHLPRAVYGLATRLRIICRCCFELHNTIITLAPGNVDDHMQMVHHEEGGINEEVKHTIGCVGVVVKHHGDSLTLQHSRFLACQKLTHCDSEVNEAKWLYSNQVQTLKKLSSIFSNFTSLAPVSSLDPNMLAIAKYYFQWAYNGMTNYPQVIRHFPPYGIMGPFRFQSTMYQCRDEFVRLVSYLVSTGQYQLKGSPPDLPEDMIAKHAAYVTHKAITGPLDADDPYAAWYDQDLYAEPQDSRLGVLPISQITASSMGPQLAGAIEQLHNALMTVFQSITSTNNCIASMLLQGSDYSTTARFLEYNARMVCLLTNLPASSTPIIQQLAKLDLTPPPSQLKGPACDRIASKLADAIENGLKNLPEPGNIRAVDPDQYPLLMSYCSSLNRLAGVLDYVRAAADDPSRECAARARAEINQRVTIAPCTNRYMFAPTYYTVLSEFN